MSGPQEPNNKEMTLKAIKANLHSVSLNENKTTVEFVINHCKLLSISYEDRSIKLSLDLLSKDIETKQEEEKEKEKEEEEEKENIYVDQDNMMDKLTMLKESNVSNTEKEDKKQTVKITATKKKTKPKTKKKSDKKKLTPKLTPKPSPKTTPKRTSKSSKESKASKAMKPIESMMGGSNNLKKKNRRKHLRQRSKTTEDIDSFSIMSHDKWSYYSTELTAKQLIRCQGFADIKCRYKYAQELKFGSKLKREDIMEFKVPINTQRIFAYVVQDCVADGTNGEILKVQGGCGKKFVRLFVKSQMNHGVWMKLHCWYK